MSRFILFLDKTENLIDLIWNNVSVLILTIFYGRSSFFVVFWKILSVLINFDLSTVLFNFLIFISILMLLVSLCHLSQVMVRFCVG